MTDDDRVRRAVRATLNGWIDHDTGSIIAGAVDSAIEDAVMAGVSEAFAVFMEEYLRKLRYW